MVNKLKKIASCYFFVENYLQLINEEALFTLKCERSVPTADNAYPYWSFRRILNHLYIFFKSMLYSYNQAAD